MNLLGCVIMILCIGVSHVLAGKKRITMDEWLLLRYEQIEAYEDEEKVRASTLKGPYPKNKDGYFTYFPERNGRIKFADGTWLLLTSHSAHAEDGIGDITLIKTSDGKYFMNRGHCCATFMIRSKIEIKSLKDFLASMGVGPEAKMLAWQEYKLGDKVKPEGDSKK